MYGAGFLGKKTKEIFSLFHIEPICYCDDDSEKQNTYIEGIPCFSLDEGVHRYPNAVYLLCVNEVPSVGDYERKTWTFMMNRLKEKKVTEVFPVSSDFLYVSFRYKATLF